MVRMTSTQEICTTSKAHLSSNEAPYPPMLAYLDASNAPHEVFVSPGNHVNAPALLDAKDWSRPISSEIWKRLYICPCQLKPENMISTISATK